MKHTVSNENKVIVTKGTEHKAFATSPDTCVVPGQGPQPFDNYVTSDKLNIGATIATFIAGFKVWTSRGELGPPSKPSHAGTDKGASSSTYCAEIVPTSYSQDVFFEDGAAVRSEDTTKQNGGNTKGVVMAASLTATSPDPCADTKKIDALVKRLSRHDRQGAQGWAARRCRQPATLPRRNRHAVRSRIVMAARLLPCHRRRGGQPGALREAAEEAGGDPQGRRDTDAERLLAPDAHREQQNRGFFTPAAPARSSRPDRSRSRASATW